MPANPAPLPEALFTRRGYAVEAAERAEHFRDDDGAVFVLENAVGAAFQHKQKALHLALRRQIDLGTVALMVWT